jgi:hypothetical protein
MIRAYLSERLRLVPFIPLALVIALGAAGGATHLASLALDAMLAWLLLAEFRLWDDLADRGTDAARHPHRVLVQSASITPFVRAGILLGAAGGGWILLRDGWGSSLALLALVHLALGGWYWFRRGRSLAGDQLLLAKYPAFVFIVSGARANESPAVVAAAAAGIYVGVSLYEAWHDPVSPLGNVLGGRP